MDRKGFTLLELSIVIVIIGLIVAGISAGQSLVRQASLRSLSSEFNQIRQSVNSFILAYDALPGDMVNAWDYWGLSCADTEANCNGNGNNKVRGVGGSPATEIDEEWMAWKHMNLAEVFPGAFAGTAADGSYGGGDCLTGFNIPAAPITSTGYRFESHDASGLDIIDRFDHNVNIMVQYGANVDNIDEGSCADGAALSPSEAKALDTKIDDGFELTGRLLAWDSEPDCLDGSDNYDLSQTTPQCRMFFDPQY